MKQANSDQSQTASAGHCHGPKTVSSALLASLLVSVGALLGLIVYFLPPAARSATATPPTALDQEDHNATVLRWRWLKGTTWYVPARNPFGVVLTDAQTITPVFDQTVYQISDYHQGYFWGKLVKQLTGSEPQCMTLIGSVTPEGWLQMSLVHHDNATAASVSRGVGIMRFVRGEWTMEWQGSSGPDATTQYSHWAYMTLTHPGLPSWAHLPFVNMSVEEFLAQCPGDGPKLVELGGAEFGD